VVVIDNGDHVGSSRGWSDHVMMDFDPDITGIASQPFWLHWQDEDGRPVGPPACRRAASARLRSGPARCWSHWRGAWPRLGGEVKLPVVRVIHW